MQSKAETVSAYLDEVPEERRAALTHLRSLCLEHLPGFSEGMAYGMPGYSRNGTVEVGFANQKQNIALYILRKDVLDRYRAEFAKSNIGKGCIRYPNPAKIDFDVVVRLLQETSATEGPICE